MDISPEDRRALIQDKYDGDTTQDLSNDMQRLIAGEPLAYVIGWVPFLGLRIDLTSRPLIPRVETEYWTEKLIAHLKERFGEEPFTLLDLCSGSGAIGLAILQAFPAAQVSFSDVVKEHAVQVRHNLALNNIDPTRARIYTGDLFSSLETEHFDVIATNPPYVPSTRMLPSSVTDFEPSTALYAGADGLGIIRQILSEASAHLADGGEIWIECDMEHASAVAEISSTYGFLRTTINQDQYGRPRFVVSYCS